MPVCRGGAEVVAEGPEEQDHGLPQNEQRLQSVPLPPHLQGQQLPSGGSLRADLKQTLNSGPGREREAQGNQIYRGRIQGGHLDQQESLHAEAGDRLPLRVDHNWEDEPASSLQGQQTNLPAEAVDRRQLFLPNDCLPQPYHGPLRGNSADPHLRQHGHLHQQHSHQKY